MSTCPITDCTDPSIVTYAVVLELSDGRRATGVGEMCSFHGSELANTLQLTAETRVDSIARNFAEIVDDQMQDPNTNSVVVRLEDRRP